MVVANDPSGTGKLEANEAEDSEGADGDGDEEGPAAASLQNMEAEKILFKKEAAR